LTFFQKFLPSQSSPPIPSFHPPFFIEDCQCSPSQPPDSLFPAPFPSTLPPFASDAWASPDKNLHNTLPHAPSRISSAANSLPLPFPLASFYFSADAAKIRWFPWSRTANLLPLFITVVFRVITSLLFQACIIFSFFVQPSVPLLSRPPNSPYDLSLFVLTYTLSLTFCAPHPQHSVWFFPSIVPSRYVPTPKQSNLSILSFPLVVRLVKILTLLSFTPQPFPFYITPPILQNKLGFSLRNPSVCSPA